MVKFHPYVIDYVDGVLSIIFHPDMDTKTDLKERLLLLCGVEFDLYTSNLGLVMWNSAGARLADRQLMLDTVHEVCTAILGTNGVAHPRAVTWAKLEWWEDDAEASD